MVQTFLLDFSECKTQRQLHEHIRAVFDLPHWYGNNLDALWDVLTGMIPLPADITILFKPLINEDRIFQEYLGKIISLFLSAQQYTELIKIHVDINF